MRQILPSLLLLLPTLVMGHMTRCASHEEAETIERDQQSAAPLFAGRMAASQADPVLFHQTAHFVLLYTTTGPHAVAGADIDLDKNGVPDNIQAIGEIAERVWRLGVDTLQYKAPPGRDSATGYRVRTKTGKFPIVIGDMSTFSTSFAGKGYMSFSLRPLVDPDSLGGGQVLLDNDFLDEGAPIQVKVGPENSANGVDSLLYDYSKDPIKGWSVGFAHDFYHSLQFQYDQSYRYAWHEMTATWFATRAFPDIKHHWQYLPAFIKNNFDGPFATWDPIAPYFNFAFVTMAVNAFGEDFIRVLWPDHRDSFQIDEDLWFANALMRKKYSEHALLSNYSGEFLRLTENSPGVLNEGGAWVNSRTSMTTIAFKKSPLVAPPGHIQVGSQYFGNTYVEVHRDQFDFGSIALVARSPITSAGGAIFRYPSMVVETFNLTVDTTFVHSKSGDTAWVIGLISGTVDRATGGSIPAAIASSRKSSSILRPSFPSEKIPLLRFDLHGRPATSATRGIILEGSPESGWQRRVNLRKE